MTEVWKPVVGHPGYEVSDLGRVRSLDRWCTQRGRGGKLFRFWKPGRVLSGRQRGYQQVEISGRTFGVHALVLEAFVGPRPPGQVCRHLNGDRRDARLSNLAYGTHEENCADDERNGTRVRGRRHGLARLTDEQVREARSLWPSVSQPQLASRYGVTQGTIWRAINRRTWTHV